MQKYKIYFQGLLLYNSLIFAISVEMQIVAVWVGIVSSRVICLPGKETRNRLSWLSATSVGLAIKEIINRNGCRHEKDNQNSRFKFFSSVVIQKQNLPVWLFFFFTFFNNFEHDMIFICSIFCEPSRIWNNYIFEDQSSGFSWRTK